MIALMHRIENAHDSMYNYNTDSKEGFRSPSSSLEVQSATPISTRNSADEAEAIAALISLPSLGAESSTTMSFHSPQGGIKKSNYHFCMEAPLPLVSTEHQSLLLHRHSSSFSSSSTMSTIDSFFYGTDQLAGPWYTGSTSLAITGDEDVLSPLHCFMRKFCVEAFSATTAEIATPRYGKAHGGKIVVGQVGIRCLHCKHLNRERPERAVCFPSSLRNIYHSIETWQRRHIQVCTEIPSWIRREMTSLMQSNRISAGGRRQYWEDAATQLGMIDTPQGVRFARPPGTAEVKPQSSNRCAAISYPDSSPGTSLVTPNDKILVTEYLFVLISQMQVCRFTEEDRTGGRSKVKNFDVGYPGMECKHCCGKAGFGRYFPSSVDALALANSDRNIYNHLQKCRKCPESIKLQLKSNRPDSAKNKRGSRKRFFARVWDRIHAEETSSS